MIVPYPESERKHRQLNGLPAIALVRSWPGLMGMPVWGSQVIVYCRMTFFLVPAARTNGISSRALRSSGGPTLSCRCAHLLLTLVLRSLQQVVFETSCFPHLRMIMGVDQADFALYDNRWSLHSQQHALLQHNYRSTGVNSGASNPLPHYRQCNVPDQCPARTNLHIQVSTHLMRCTVHFLA